MKVSQTELPGVFLIELASFPDERGFFRELFRFETLAPRLGAKDFVQDNLSVSHKGVIRGMHLQRPPTPQGKLVSCVHGSIWDVAVDVRRDSPHYGKWVGYELSFKNGRALYIPEGFAHGFQALENESTIVYKCTGYYDGATETGFRFDDPQVGISWPLKEQIVSAKDQKMGLLSEMPL